MLRTKQRCLARTWSSERNGNEKVGWPRITTTAKFTAAARICSTGSVISSNTSRASFLNHSASALSAAIGPRQNSGSIPVPTVAP